MRRRIGLFIAVMALFTALLAAPATASAGGLTPGQLSSAGWNCFVAGPHDWVHCFAPQSGQGKALNVMVFGVVGDDAFRGTELLINASVYRGQPCSTDGGDPYHAVDGTPFMGCHHFDTSQ